MAAVPLARSGVARRGALLAATLFLAACSQAGTDQPGAVSADEARQLNDAAEMLDDNSVDADALGPTNRQEP